MLDLVAKFLPAGALAAGTAVTLLVGTPQPTPLRKPLTAALPASFMGSAGSDVAIGSDEVSKSGVSDYVNRVYMLDSTEGVALNNGELVTVKCFRRGGGLVVEDGSGRTKTLTQDQRLLNRGYAVTSYASQGKTVDTVLFADAASRAASNDQQWYVTISRGRKRVIVFTTDKEALRLAAHRAGARPLALEVSPLPSSTSRRAPAWVQRARAVVATLQRITFLQRRRQTVSVRPDPVRPAHVRPPGVRPHL